MAIMLGGAAFHAAQKLKARLLAIGAHDLKIPLQQATYSGGDVLDRAASQRRRSWAELVTIAHRYFHRLPPDTEPGLAFTHVMQVPTGGQLPTADGRVQMYPCFAFEFHLLLLTIDPDLGKTDIRRYFIGHDCGTVINPKIVRGMTMGGIAHGMAQRFMRSSPTMHRASSSRKALWTTYCRQRMRCRPSTSSTT
jgi:CO/xanthine dehydrogenase Mo-binding subunit